MFSIIVFASIVVLGVWRCALVYRDFKPWYHYIPGVIEIGLGGFMLYVLLSS